MESVVCREASREITMLSFVPIWAFEDAIDYLYKYFATKYKELRISFHLKPTIIFKYNLYSVMTISKYRYLEENIIPETSHKGEDHAKLQGILFRFESYKDKLQFLRDCNKCFASTLYSPGNKET